MKLEIDCDKYPIDKLHQLRRLGGHEGAKYLANLQNPRYVEGGANINPTLPFFLKRYPEKKVNKLIGVIENYEYLRQKGFPVPNTTRFYRDETGLYLLMSDMTEGGRYLLWGYSNDMTPHQSKDLKDMELNQCDIAKIHLQAFFLADIASDINTILPFWGYHVRQNKITKNLNIILLDVLPKKEVIPRNHQSLLETNQCQCNIFASELDKAIFSNSD